MSQASAEVGAAANLETLSGHVIVCGLDHLGLRVACELRKQGEDVVVVSRGHSEHMEDLLSASGALLLRAGHLEERELVRAGIAKARCLVLTDDDDLGNLHVALTAQEINQDIRVVLRMFSSELGQRAELLLSNCRIFSSSAVAAPMFAAALVGDDLNGHMVAWGHRLLVRSSRGGEVLLAHLDEGDRQHYIHDGGQLAEGVAQRRLRSLFRSLRALLVLADRRLAGVLLVITLFALFAAAIFHSFYTLSWVDAIYFTVTTISTVGYGDINMLGAPSWLKIFDVGVMLLGATSLAALYALITDAVVGARLALAMGVPHGRMKGHYVVCGLGSVGYRVVESIVESGFRVAAADVKDNARFIGLARRMGVPVLVGDARLSDNLRLLSVDSAAGLLAATDDDVANLEMALAAHEMNPNLRVVVRLFDPQLAERARRSLGLPMAHSSSALAAPSFIAASIEDGCVGTVGRDKRWLVGEINVDGAGNIAGRSVAEIAADDDIRVLAARAEDVETWAPNADHMVGPGHRLLLCATRERFRRLRSRAAANKVSGRRDRKNRQAGAV